jgi:phage RecT family recombinase
MSQSITKRSLELSVMQRREKFLALIPDHVADKDKFLKRLAVEVELMCHRNKALSSCNPASLLLAAMEAARHRLSFSHGDCSVIPFRGKGGGSNAVFVLGAPGIAKVLYRTGLFTRIEWETVRERDQFKAPQGSEPSLCFEKALKNRGDVVCAYALAEMKDGTKHIYVMDYDTLMKIRNVSPSSGSTYSEWEDEMFAKAPMKRLFKRLPIDPDIVEQAAAVSSAIDADNSYRDPDGDIVDWASLSEEDHEVSVVDVKKKKPRRAPRKGGPTEEEMAALSKLADEAEEAAREMGGRE